MKKPTLSLLLPFLLTSLAMSACSRRVPNTADQQIADRQYYAREAYREQHIKKNAPFDSPYLDEPTEDDLVLNLEGDPLKDWRRQSYESVEEWLDRLHRELVSNHQRILLLEEKMDSLTTEEEGWLNELHASVVRSEELRRMLEEWEEPETAAEELPATALKEQGVADTGSRTGSERLDPPEFMIHLVQKGETLYSIAQFYYDDGKKARDILLWNQGWIRSPYELLAGTGIVLFPEDAKEKKQQVVDAYLHKLESVE